MEPPIYEVPGSAQDFSLGRETCAGALAFLSGKALVRVSGNKAEHGGRGELGQEESGRGSVRGPVKTAAVETSRCDARHLQDAAWCGAERE